MKWLLNIFLVFIARTGLYILSIPLFVISILISLIRFFKVKGNPVAKYFLDLAIALDVLANVLGGPVWNLIFLKGNVVVKFGSRFDTMSFVFGMNKAAGTLNKFGLFWCWFLNKLEKDHVEKAINLN